MGKIRLLLAAAGSGKTEYIVQEALGNPGVKALIVTYTQSNEMSIRRRIAEKSEFASDHITVQTWDSFLLRHAIRPFQGSLKDDLYEGSINGMMLVNNASAKYCSEDKCFNKFYFCESGAHKKVYSDKIAKLAVRCCEKSRDASTRRIAKLFNTIYVDECQDLAGYDLDFLLLLSVHVAELVFVGDPRQVTYLTHWEQKNRKYRNGKLKEYLEDRKILFTQDVNTLNLSHRCNSHICDFASRIYPEMPPTQTCVCCAKSSSGLNGLFLVQKKDAPSYLAQHGDIVQLRYNSKTIVENGYDVLTFGDSKGLTFNNVLIYPTKEITKWIYNPATQLAEQTKAKFYVAVTRARHSVGLVVDGSSKSVPGTIMYDIPK